MFYVSIFLFCQVDQETGRETRAKEDGRGRGKKRRLFCKHSLAQCFAHRQLLAVYIICQPCKKGILHHPATIPYLLVLLKLLILLLIKFLI